MIIAKRPDDTLHLFFAPTDSAIANTLCYLFNVRVEPERGFAVSRFDVDEAILDLVRSSILQHLDVAPIDEMVDPDYEDLVTAHFGNSFPTTKEFSAFARDTVNDVDPVNHPDETLLRWMQREESLFFALEKVVVEEKLAEGFDDVDDFVSFSLGVQNRRKSRAGWALERHLAEIFEANGLEFEQGAMTENRAKPDFLFPGAAEYHDPEAKEESLLMLGAKTCCKERWRQVLSEAARIKEKHLLTLEPGISESQLAEMKANGLNLVVPQPLHVTYSEAQQDQLMSVADFIDLAHTRQSARSDGEFG
ncbi:MAG: restriction endonuclease [Pseudomonadales bacterium]|nr:restriction endonuclease [Pseudomonadales bacterium]